MVILLTTMEAKGAGRLQRHLQDPSAHQRAPGEDQGLVGQTPAESKGEKIHAERFKKMVS